MKLPIESIAVGERRREELGDIAGLAASIEKYGLLHPIVIDSERNLVAGERRLVAHKKLGRTEIEARDIGELTPLELREIELEENVRRKDLTPFEKSRVMVEYIEAAREAAEEEAKREAENPKPEKVSVPTVDKNHSGGRPPGKKAGSVRDVEERTGVPRQTQQKAKEHVATATRYPFMQGKDWSQVACLEANKALAQLDEDEKDKAAALVNQPATPPKQAVGILENLTRKPKEERQRIFDDFASGVPKRVDDALTSAAAVPPMPDARPVINKQIIKQIGDCIAYDPDDGPVVAEYERAKAIFVAITQQIKKGV